MKKTKLFLFSIFTFINLVFGVNFATAQTISVEAESGTFNRGASSQSCGSCSGGNHVGNLGGLSSSAPNGYLASTVTVSVAGTYTLSLYASSGVSRSIFVGVNGGIGTEVVVNSGDWSTPAMYQTVITLAQGTNTIKFYNDISYAPNIDKFDLTLLSATPCTDCYGPFEAEAGVINAPASISSCSTCSGGQHVGDMGYSDRFFTYTLPNITTAGTYRLFLSYISGSTRSLTVTVNGTTDYTTTYNSVDWNVVYVKEIDIVLPAGVNTLKFHNTTSDWAPNVDKFRLQYLAATSIGSVTQSQCGGTYTWPVNNVTYSASTTQTVVSGNNVATLNLTITPPTTNGSVTHVQTGGNYFWAANGQTYTSSGTYTHVVGCNTATLNLTLLPAETCSGCYGPFEAEDATLNRGASVQNCSSCSGGKHVGNLGGSAASFPNSYLAYTVNVPVAGTYTLSLSASAADTRSIFVGVNGGSETEVVVNSGGWSTPAIYQITVTLAQGTNSIEFYNDNSFAPNIDKFNLTLLSAITCTDCYGPFEAEAGIITAPATVGICSTCSGGQHVTDMGFSDRFFNYTLPNITTAGTYRLYLSYVSGTDRSLTVTVNGTTDYTAIYNSIDWNVVSVKEIDVVLPAGVNTLKFHNTTSDWAPNVDKFRLQLLSNLSLDDKIISTNSIYPNPTKNDWNVVNQNKFINDISIFDTSGKKVINLQPNSNETLIDGSTLNKGVYFSKITTDTGVETFKLIKE